MRNFRYIARDPAGKDTEGLVQAESRDNVIAWLYGLEMTPVSVELLKTKGRGSHRLPGNDALSNVCWQMATMTEGGVSITEAIETIGDDVDNLQLQNALNDISTDIKSGNALSESVAKHPRIFGNLFQAMIIAGETSGSLGTVLRRLADHFEKRDKLAKKVKHAMAYPIFVFGFVMLILVVMMTFVIPKFKAMFEDNVAEDKIPAFSRMFMAGYDAVIHNMPIVACVMAAMLVAFVAYSRTAAGHRHLNSLALKVPIMGKIISQAFLASFCRTMATLLSAGISVLEALEILAGTTSNELIRESVLDTREKIMQGGSISGSMASTGFFPNLVVKMTQVGETSGSLPPSGPRPTQAPARSGPPSGPTGRRRGPIIRASRLTWSVGLRRSDPSSASPRRISTADTSSAPPTTLIR